MPKRLSSRLDTLHTFKLARYTMPYTLSGRLYMVGVNQFSWLKKEARKIKYKAVFYVIDNKAFRGRVLDSLGVTLPFHALRVVCLIHLGSLLISKSTGVACLIPSGSLQLQGPQGSPLTPSGDPSYDLVPKFRFHNALIMAT